MSDTNNESSLGERRVRTSFNPANNSTVDQIKQKSADMINICEEMRTPPEGGSTPVEKHRLVALAQTAFEEGAMWAVKAATTT